MEPWIGIDYLEVEGGTDAAAFLPPPAVSLLFSRLKHTLDAGSSCKTMQVLSDRTVLLNLRHHTEAMGWLTLAMPDRFWVSSGNQQIIWINGKFIHELGALAAGAPSEPKKAASAPRMADALRQLLSTGSSAGCAPRVLMRQDDGSVVIDMSSHLAVLGWLALSRPSSLSVLKGYTVVRLSASLVAELAPNLPIRAPRGNTWPSSNQTANHSPNPSTEPSDSLVPAEPPDDAEPGSLPNVVVADLVSIVEQCQRLLDGACAARASLPLAWPPLLPLDVLALALIALLLEHTDAAPPRCLDDGLLDDADADWTRVNGVFALRAQLMARWREANAQPSASRIAALASALQCDGLLLTSAALLAALRVHLDALAPSTASFVRAFVAAQRRQASMQPARDPTSWLSSKH